MKIALSLPSFDPTIGGLEAWACGLAEQLLRQGHEVHVVAPRFAKAESAAAIVAHKIRASRSVLRRAVAAEAKLRVIGADVVHDMGLTWAGDVRTLPGGAWPRRREQQIAAAAWWKRPAKRVASGLLPGHRGRAELARRQLEAGDSVIVAQSEMVAGDYADLHGLAAEEIRVIRGGIDIKRFAPHIRKLRRETTRRKLGVGAKELLLLTVDGRECQLQETTTLRAMRFLKRKGHAVRLILAGDVDTARFEKQVERFGLGEVAKSLGAVSDLTPFYAAADALIQPALHDPCCLNVLEAAACSLPCVTTSRDGASELLTDGSDGYILQRLNARELAGRLELLLDTPKREKMGRAARRTAMKHTLQSSVDRLLGIYKEVVAARSGSGDRANVLAMPQRSVCQTPSRRAA